MYSGILLYKYTYVSLGHVILNGVFRLTILAFMLIILQSSKIKYMYSYVIMFLIFFYFVSQKLF